MKGGESPRCLQTFGLYVCMTLPNPAQVTCIVPGYNVNNTVALSFVCPFQAMESN
jgi:hypothetical protein